MVQDRQGRGWGRQLLGKLLWKRGKGPENEKAFVIWNEHFGTGVTILAPFLTQLRPRKLSDIEKRLLILWH
jgi:hypothetical protein